MKVEERATFKVTKSATFKVTKIATNVTFRTEIDLTEGTFKIQVINPYKDRHFEIYMRDNELLSITFRTITEPGETDETRVRLNPLLKKSSNDPYLKFLDFSQLLAADSHLNLFSINLVYILFWDTQYKK